MRLFFVLFFALYTALHIYALLRLRSAFAIGMKTTAFISLFMLLQILAPVIVRYAEKYGFDSPARVVAFAGYTWMGIIFLFFCSSIVIEAYRFIVPLIGRVLEKDASFLIPSHRAAFLLPLGLSLCITVYGFWEAGAIKTERLVIKSPKIPAEVGKVRIVQVSDVHVGVIIRERRIRQIVEMVKRESPDIFVSTGDLMDGQISRLNGVVDLLRSVTARYGKYAIPGNHEYYAGIGETLQSTREAGFRILRGETADGVIAIAGVDDPAGQDFGRSRDLPETGLLGSLPESKFRLFLKHRPLVEESSLGLFDLQLSGHTHKGQIFPFSIIIHYIYPLDAGAGHLLNGSMLYVSRGTGTWGPPIRFLAPPEITVIDLVHGERSL